MDYSFVVTGYIPIKIFDIFKDSILENFRAYKSLHAEKLKQDDSMGIFLIALDDIQFKEDEVQKVE